jgi:hypothetical protein
MVRSIFESSGKNMTKINTLLFCLLLPSFALAHGVERGSVRQAIANFGMKEDTKALLVAEVLNRCKVSGASQITAIAQEREYKVDQGVTDRYFTIRIEALLPGTSQPEVILVEVAEYAFSNPTVDNIEILSIESDICR